MSYILLLCLLICLCVCGTLSQDVRPCATSWTIGEPQRLVCRTNNMPDAITLQLKVNNEFVKVSSCNTTGECTDYMAPVYTSRYFGLFEHKGEGKYTMSIDITSARVNETTFRCVYGDTLSDVVCFEMSVSAGPSKPVCEPPVFVNSNTQIRISCTSHRTFPNAYMTITVMKGDSVSHDNYKLDREIKASSSLVDPGSEVENFTVIIHLSSLEPAPYQFPVRVYTGFSNETLAKERLFESALLSMVLTAPQVRLSNDCQADIYITSGTCKCELSTPGNPPGQARWYTQSGQVVGTENSEDRSSTLELTVSGITADPSPSYYWCRAVTVLNVSVPSTVAFSPKLASAPKVRLSSDCQSDSYITSGTCKCELTTLGNPPGQARWYTQSGQVVGTENSEDGSSTLELTVSGITPDPSTSNYWCRAVTVLNVSVPSTIAFTPKLPFGPSSVIIETSDNGKFDLCPSEERVTTVTCKVATEDVKPGVTMTIMVNSDIVVDRSEGKITGYYYVQDYIFRPAKPGSYSVICRAENVHSSQLTMSQSFTIVVREPPSSAPVFLIPGSVPGSKLANVLRGKTISVTCKVDGGYPPVSEVTIRCGSRSQQVQGKIASLSLEVTNAVDGLMCHCAATHDSDCYDKESIVFLQVQARGQDTIGLKTEVIIGIASAAAVVIVAIVIAFILGCKRKTRRALDLPPADPKFQNNPVQTGTELHEYLTPRDIVDTDPYSVINHYDCVIHPDTPNDNSGSYMYSPSLHGKYHLSY